MNKGPESLKSSTMGPRRVPKKKKKEQREPDILDIYESNWDEVTPTFEDLDLDPDLLRGIYGRNMEKPSAIQQKAIKPCLIGHDVVMQAQSGTGKTAAFAIAALSKIKKNLRQVQVLVLAPTRELAQQLITEIQSLANNMPWVKCYACIGEMTFVSDDMREILSGMNQIIVGTPGRIWDLFGRFPQGEYSIHPLDSIRLIVIDEADEMLMKKKGRQGLKQQIERIFDWLRDLPVQKIMASATFPPDCKSIARRYMSKDPILCLIKKELLTLEGVKQYYVDVEDHQFKLATLCDIYSFLPITQAIIFCNTKRTVEILTKEMLDRDHTVSAIHGDMDQVDRTRIFNDFRKGTTRVLISSDLCGRGIDIKQVSHVINYDLPESMVTYMHRVGRTGRYGGKGCAISFIARHDPPLPGDDLYSVQELGDFYKTQIEKLQMNAPTNDL